MTAESHVPFNHSFTLRCSAVQYHLGSECPVLLRAAPTTNNDRAAAKPLVALHATAILRLDQPPWTIGLDALVVSMQSLEACVDYALLEPLGELGARIMATWRRDGPSQASIAYKAVNNKE